MSARIPIDPVPWFSDPFGWTNEGFGNWGDRYPDGFAIEVVLIFIILYFLLNYCGVANFTISKHIKSGFQSGFNKVTGRFGKY